MKIIKPSAPPTPGKVLARDLQYLIPFSLGMRGATYLRISDGLDGWARLLDLESGIPYIYEPNTTVDEPTYYPKATLTLVPDEGGS